jgi:histidinol dehydrogenase
MERSKKQGSIHTQAAKLLVFGKVVIDMVAGPSEAIILADEKANPVFCAADILARVEHSPDAAGVLVIGHLS